jgi:hypothetical protein
MFDVETLGKESSAVILSLACTYFDPTKNPSPDDLRRDSCFVKFDAQDQIKRLKRTITPSSVQWWGKQCENVKKKSVNRSEDDMIIEEGIEAFRKWTKKFPNNEKCWVWARGNLDQLVMDSLEERCGIEPVFSYNRWRDVRTFIDITFETDNGYVGVDYEGFDPNLHITKHDPVDDCIFDVMMMLYGNVPQGETK